MREYIDSGKPTFLSESFKPKVINRNLQNDITKKDIPEAQVAQKKYQYEKILNENEQARNLQNKDKENNNHSRDLEEFIPNNRIMTIEAEHETTGKFISKINGLDFTFMPKKPTEGDPIVLLNLCTNSSGEKVTYLWYVDGKHIEEKDNQMTWELIGLKKGFHNLQLKVRKESGGGDNTISKIIEIK